MTVVEPPVPPAVPPVAPPAGPLAAPRSVAAGWKIVAGAIVAGIGSVLPWVGAYDNYQRMEWSGVSTMPNGQPADGIIVLVFAGVVAAAGFGVMSGGIRGLGVRLVGLLTVIPGLVVFNDLSTATRSAREYTTYYTGLYVGPGMYVALVGLCITLVGAATSMRRK